MIFEFFELPELLLYGRGNFDLLRARLLAVAKHHPHHDLCGRASFWGAGHSSILIVMTARGNYGDVTRDSGMRQAAGDNSERRLGNKIRVGSDKVDAGSSGSGDGGELIHAVG